MNPFRTIASSGMLIAVLLASCAPRPAGVTLDTSQTSVAELMDRMRAEDSRLRSLTGSGTLAFEAPEMSGSASFQLSLQKPDSLLVRLEGPFGIDVGFLFLSRSRFVLYNSLENRVMEGRPTASAVRSFLPTDFTPVELVDALCGRYPIDVRQGKIIKYAVEEGEFLLALEADGGISEFRVDPVSLLVTRYRQKNAAGQVIVDVEAGAVTEQDGVYAPRRLALVFPQTGRQIAVLYSSITINDPAPSFTFSVPQGARQREGSFR